MTKKQRMTSGTLKNKVMNKDTYQLRRKVMSFIYEIKNIVPDTPRVDVRITDSHDTDSNAKIVAQARLKDKVIWISDYIINKPENVFRNTVYHEMLHAVYGIGHDNDCPVMCQGTKNVSKEKCQKVYMSYVGNFN